MYNIEKLNILPVEKMLKFNDHYNILHTIATTKAKTIKTSINSLTETWNMSHNQKNK